MPKWSREPSSWTTPDKSPKSGLGGGHWDSSPKCGQNSCRLIFVLGQDICIVALHRIITKKLIRKTESWSHLRHPKRALVIPTFASLCDSCDVFLARHSIRSLETGSNCAWRTGTGTDLMTMDISVTTPGEVVQVWSLTQFYSIQLAFHNNNAFEKV